MGFMDKDNKNRVSGYIFNLLKDALSWTKAYISGTWLGFC